ncbi:P-loop NTPase fold protein [Xanthocytophaga agilis]|uniref:P-loop NTPase fold protein n=1 Tax=Xanthocytophaga agilis TaxID=3048010 RepID=A0AAE3R8J2_9BACT|nr:P-loop NTPase fold protein [Xanthocytophaga agilis]MDJ1503547.1 P-loop NTPase fold protein [Xanthocytophaga agilis]
MNISLKAPSELFYKHLNSKDNYRILFSGPFGIGKTYFLNDFFDKRTDDYLTVYLSPVHYSVASNEDIFKFIKFDILQELNRKYHLLEALEADFEENYKELDNVIDNTTFFLWSFIANFSKIIEASFYMIPEVNIANASEDGNGPDLTFASLGNLPQAGIDILKNVLKDAEELKKVIASHENSPEAKSYLEELSNNYIYERDPVTIFITEVLNLLSEIQLERTNKKHIKKTQKKQKVLIIDDLDRIDPEHIFRLFNVFSSHLGSNSESENKFSFDKIIFVCDIDNIRGMFQVRYGTPMGFNGYIDKFYSQQVFYFDNRSAIIEFLQKDFFDRKKPKEYEEQFIMSTLFKEIGLVVYIIEAFIRTQVLNLRTLKKISGKLLIPKENHLQIFINPNDREVTYFRNIDYPILLITEFLNQFFSKSDDFIDALNSCSLKLSNASNQFLSSEKGTPHFWNIVLFSRRFDHSFKAIDVAHKSSIVSGGSFQLLSMDEPLKSVVLSITKNQITRTIQYYIEGPSKAPISERMFFQELTSIVSFFKEQGLYDNIN